MRKIAALFLGCMVIVTFWYIEKTKQISQYGIVFHEMGMQCSDECKKDRRLKYFQKAIHHDPNLSAAHYQLALTYEEMRDYDRSVESFRRVTELDYENTSAFYKVGVQYFKEGNYERALRYLLVATVYGRKGYPDDAIYYIAQIYDRKGDYDKAIGYYNTIASRPEYAPKAYLRLAEIYHSIGRNNFILDEVRRLRRWVGNDSADLLKQAYDAVQASEALKNEHE